MPTFPEKFQNFLKKEFSSLKPSTPEFKKPIELTKEEDKFLLEILKKAREEEKKGNLVEAIKLYQKYKEEYLKLREKKEKKEKEIETKIEKEGKIIGMEIIKGTEVKVGGAVYSCSISPDGTFAIIGSGDRTARLAEIKRNKEGKIIGMEIIPGTEVKVGGYVESCSISPDGTFAIVGSWDDCTARLAEIRKDREGKIIGMGIIKGTEVEAGGTVESCSISPDGTFAIVGSWDDCTARLAEIKRDKEGKITAMEIIKGTEVEVEEWVRSCSISPDGSFAIIGSDDDHTARLAEIKRDKEGKIIGMEIIPRTEVKVGGKVYSCSISPDGTFAIIGSGEDRTARLAEIKRNKEGKITAMEIIPGTEVEVEGAVFSCSISPDGSFAIIGSDDDHTARLAEIKRDKEGKIIGMEIIKGTEVKVGGAVYSCSISPDGTFAIIGSWNNHTACLAEIKREKI